MKIETMTKQDGLNLLCCRNVTNTDFYLYKTILISLVYSDNPASIPGLPSDMVLTPAKRWCHFVTSLPGVEFVLSL